ncbi:HigA family addiction module antitoxin [Phyllobacterium sp. 21LDTY02-6]|uniref:HigA family addiction module antitoxin n=1 Tax=Phyllobacterium sp. 21LDTY02-6 TaxID=2944903 RepID=UPI002021653C|nr:HigA family addiction module antitoxin [Phyllobacterium sp. 21LDTY02-6]MCO4315905.1 HigA family addiction module antitoxin [Phyllobacterium sp. 21LDTY02-6]
MARIVTHPGEMLKHAFMIPMNLSARKLAEAMDVPANRITQLILGERGMTGDTAARLERVLGVSAEFWMNLQAAHDLSKAKATHDYSSIRPLEDA